MQAMGKLTLIYAIPILVAVFLLSRGGEAAETRFTIVDSSPTSWVARGFSDYTIVPDDTWSFAASRNVGNGVDILVSRPPVIGQQLITYWNMEFAAPFDATIVPGRYEDFRRYPFQFANEPGLEFGSTARLDNMATGVFEVYEAAYGPSGEVVSFAADFTHYGELRPENFAIVEVRYNSTYGEQTVPEPASLSLLLMTMLLSARQRRRIPALAHFKSAS